MNPEVVIFSSTPGRGSGAERMLEYLLDSEEIRPLVSAVIAPPGSSVAEFAHSRSYPLLEWNAKDSLRSGTMATMELLRNHRAPEGARIIHAWHTRGFEFALAMAKTWHLEPTGTLHDHPTIHRHSWLRRRIIQWAGTRLQRLVVVSDALSRVCRESGWKLPITTIKNGLPPLDRPQSLLRGKFTIGFVGLNARWKGIDVLSDAVAETKELPIQWRLYGEPSEDVAPVVARLRAEFPDRIQTPGFRAAHELFSEFDLLFHPSLEFDPFPTALLESSRAGVPAVASDSGGSGEIIRDGITGILYDAGNRHDAIAALREMMRDADRRNKFGTQARLYFEANFPLSAMVANYIQFWR